MVYTQRSASNKKPFARDKTLDQKDYTMASMNATTTASKVVELEIQLATARGTDPLNGLSVAERFDQVYAEVYGLHMDRVDDAAQAVATVTQAFPNATVEQPTSGDPGDTVLPAVFKKHAGKTIAQVYSDDPTYIRNFIAEKAREADLKAAAQAFLRQVDEEDVYS